MLTKIELDKIDKDGKIDKRIHLFSSDIKEFLKELNQLATIGKVDLCLKLCIEGNTNRAVTPETVMWLFDLEKQLDTKGKRYHEWENKRKLALSKIYKNNIEIINDAKDNGFPFLICQILNIPIREVRDAAYRALPVAFENYLSSVGNVTNNLGMDHRVEFVVNPSIPIDFRELYLKDLLECRYEYLGRPYRFDIKNLLKSFTYPNLINENKTLYTNPKDLLTFISWRSNNCKYTMKLDEKIHGETQYLLGYATRMTAQSILGHPMISKSEKVHQLLKLRFQLQHSDHDLLLDSDPYRTRKLMREITSFFSLTKILLGNNEKVEKKINLANYVKQSEETIKKYEDLMLKRRKELKKPIRYENSGRKWY